MNEILRKLLASNFALFLKAQMFHWNVEGKNFSEYHAFFATIYTDLYAQNDTIAEIIRTLNEYAPGSLEVYKEISVIADEQLYPSADGMMAQLLSDNQLMIALYKEVYAIAEQNGEYQISDYAAQRLDAHKKHAWMIRSFLKD